MMDKQETSFGLLGRKIFFLNPLPPIQNGVVDELIQREYEAYVVKDRTALRRTLKELPGSIVFIDIDQAATEKEWENWIREAMKAHDLEDIRIGILTGNRSELLQNKYATMIKLPAGYTVIQRDLKITAAQILSILNANNAKGRRKYLRAAVDKEGQTIVNFPSDGRFINGMAGDISSAGFSCFFNDDPKFPPNSTFSNVQIKLKHIIINVEVTILGFRPEEASKTYVALFTQKISPDTRVKIRKYIQANLQARMDAMIGKNA
jgi:hypothetical protein